MAAVQYTCAKCHKVGAEDRCSRCKITYFCGRPCQMADWKVHKQSCIPEMADPAKPGMASGEAAKVHAAIVKEAENDPVQTFQVMMKKREQELYAAMHGHYIIHADGVDPSAPASQIPDGKMLIVHWFDPRPGSNEAKGRQEFMFHSGPSLAAELHTMTIGMLCQHRYLNGGLLYMVGEPDWLWPMIMHWRECGTVAPCPARPGMSWSEHSVFGRELGKQLSMSLGALKHGVQPGSTIGTNSHSMASVMALNIGGMEHRAKRTGERIPAALRLPFCGNDVEGMPDPREPLPAWWRRAAGLWDGALQRMVARGGKPPCQVYLTPAGVWHTPEAGCFGEHDEQWKAEVEAIKAEVKVGMAT